ncbi:MAG: ankyrin repeat domain-containing protein [Arcicella sp.]|nr:ankyrin repeat domain-containing protein [Arcicella sp.]
MKKSTIYLVASLCAFANVSFASNSKPLSNPISILSNNMASPLVMAIYKGDIQSVKKIIEYGADVNEKSNGMTPLMYAARYNKTDIIKVLIASGARINDKNGHGLNALKYAELSNANDAVTLLKQYK